MCGNLLHWAHGAHTTGLIVPQTSPPTTLPPPRSCTHCSLCLERSPRCQCGLPSHPLQVSLSSESRTGWPPSKNTAPHTPSTLPMSLLGLTLSVVFITFQPTRNGAYLFCGSPVVSPLQGSFADYSVHSPFLQHLGQCLAWSRRSINVLQIND